MCFNTVSQKENGRSCVSVVNQMCLGPEAKLDEISAFTPSTLFSKTGWPHPNWLLRQQGTLYYNISAQSGTHHSVQDSNYFSECLFTIVSSGDHQSKQASVMPPALTQLTEQQIMSVACLDFLWKVHTSPKCAGPVLEECIFFPAHISRRYYSFT